MFIGKGHNTYLKSVSYSRETTVYFFTFSNKNPRKFHVKHKRRGRRVLLPTRVWSPMSKALFGGDFWGLNAHFSDPNALPNF